MELQLSAEYRQLEKFLSPKPIVLAQLPADEEMFLSQKPIVLEQLPAEDSKSQQNAVDPDPPAFDSPARVDFPDTSPTDVQLPALMQVDSEDDGSMFLLNCFHTNDCLLKF